MKDVVARGVNGLAIAPMNADSVIGVISEARKKNIPVITFDSDSPNSQRICYVGTDNLEAGKEAGKAFKKLLPKGKYAILTGAWRRRTSMSGSKGSRKSSMGATTRKFRALLFRARMTRCEAFRSCRMS